MRPTSIAIAAAITANSHQLVCTTCGFVSRSWRIASLVTSVAAAAMITDSPSAAEVLRPAVAVGMLAVGRTGRRTAPR